MKADFDKIKGVLTRDELCVLGLRALFAESGYKQYRMSKFEEYDLYVKNKDFLVSESVITFTDTDGRLLALKPDVTLSIIKNSRDSGEGVVKLCYNENVYRVSKGTHTFKEIMQSGIECLGDIGESELVEVVSLAAESIALISGEGCLELSHLDIVSGVIESLGVSQHSRGQLLSALGQKNLSFAMGILDSEGVGEGGREHVRQLFSVYGEAEETVPRLDVFRINPEVSSAVDRLVSVIRGVKAKNPEAKLRIDFSLLGDTKYYNGITFSGFIPEVPVAVLTGGQYDNLMARIKRRDRAIGFAVYLDELERLT